MDFHPDTLNRLRVRHEMALNPYYEIQDIDLNHLTAMFNKKHVLDFASGLRMMVFRMANCGELDELLTSYSMSMMYPVLFEDVQEMTAFMLTHLLLVRPRGFSIMTRMYMIDSVLHVITNDFDIPSTAN
jgi:hypothetical protein